MLQLCYVTVAQRRYPLHVSPAAIPEIDLIDAGRRAFTRYGFRGATIARIAAEAGVSRVTLHRRGITREILLAALVETAVTDYRTRMWPVLTTSGSAAERLGRALDTVCDMAEENIGLLLALRTRSDEVFHDDPAGETLTRAVFTEPLRHILAEGMRDGTLRVTDAEHAATLLFNLVGWTYIHMRSGHRRSPKDAREELLRIVLRGVVASPEGAPS